VPRTRCVSTPRPPRSPQLSEPRGWRWGCHFWQPVSVTKTTPPSHPSHVGTTRPTPLLALLCLAIVYRLRPDWLGIGIGAAARSQGISPERVSRLCLRAVVPFETLVSGWTRMGRPPHRHQDAEQSSQQLAVTTALLAVATSILAHVPLRSARVRSLIAGAWLRLSTAHPGLTQKHFCRCLSLSPRTLRSWLVRLPETDTAAPVIPPAPPAPRPKRPPRRRFSFDVVVPGTQLAADTSDLHALGLPLKLIASQDVGGRDQSLLDSVLVDDHESAELVVRVLTEAIDGRPGLQVSVDQGTPYMAEATRNALEELRAEHAPQREHTPTDKPTIERAFRTVKGFARPLLALSDRIAEHLHRTYQLDGSMSRFVRSFRRFPLPVIQQADRAFASQAHRDDIRKPTAYFAAIVRRLADEFSAHRACRRREQQRDRDRDREIRQIIARRNAHLEDPLAGLRAALEILPEYWDPDRQRLLFDGIGPGRTGARLAIERLTDLHGPQAAADITAATLRAFARASAEHLAPAAISAIDQLVRRFLPVTPTASTTTPCAQPFLSAILPSIGKKQHPPPS